jgi:hypothetical protein
MRKSGGEPPHSKKGKPGGGPPPFEAQGKRKAVPTLPFGWKRLGWMLFVA